MFRNKLCQPIKKKRQLLFNSGAEAVGGQNNGWLSSFAQSLHHRGQSADRVFRRRFMAVQCWSSIADCRNWKVVYKNRFTARAPSIYAPYPDEYRTALPLSQ
ncbi:MAG: hypothetical protein R3C40_10845 [Parvularculaceae bacterium]